MAWFKEFLEISVPATVVLGLGWRLIIKPQIGEAINQVLNSLVLPRLATIESRLNQAEHHINANTRQLVGAGEQLKSLDERMDAIAINVGQCISINEAHRIIEAHADGVGHEATIRRLNSVEKDITDLRARMKLEARDTYTPPAV